MKKTLQDEANEFEEAMQALFKAILEDMKSILDTVAKGLLKLNWILTDRCIFCGGELRHWSDRKSICIKCGKDQF